MKPLTLLRHTLLFLMLLASSAVWAEQDLQPFRMGITTATTRNQYALLEDWRAYLQDKLDRPVEFVFRDSYGENIDLMREKKLDFAWFSAAAFLKNRTQTSLVVTPSYHGKPYDRAYLIVGAADTKTRSLLDLKGRIFAYVDTDSCTGYLDPRHQLRLGDQDPDQFFQKTFLTHDHQKVVAAVAIGLADGGTMSGYAWDALAIDRPDITAQTRIVARSAEYGFPPIIVRRTLDRKNILKMRNVLLGMSKDAEGKKLLERFNLDAFIQSDPKLYQSVALMMRHLDHQ